MKDKTTTQSIKPNKETSQLDVIPDLEIKMLGIQFIPIKDSVTNHM